MRNELNFLECADLYIKDELSPTERLEFERYCEENPQAAEQYHQHRILISKLRDYQIRKRLKTNMDALFNAQSSLKDNSIDDNSGIAIKSLWKKHRSTISVAASVALVAVFSTLWLSGFYNNVKESSHQYSLLKRDVNTIKRNVNAQNLAIKNINSDKTSIANGAYPARIYGATGFALTSNGFIATNYHVVKESNSVYVQNYKGDSYKAKVIYIDPAHDLAILDITDPSFENTAIVPYVLKEDDADLGQDVFTIGYPREQAVYGSGYLSSNTGFAGDTSSYQITVPVNPGNSGGPILDDKGNVIGIVSGKQTETDGAAFAIKTAYLLQSIKAIPQDSLSKELSINKRNSLSGLSRTEQIKKIQDYVYLVKVF